MTSSGVALQSPREVADRARDFWVEPNLCSSCSQARRLGEMKQNPTILLQGSES